MAKPPLVTIGEWQRKVSNVPPSFPNEPKEEPIDIHASLPLFQEISCSELMMDEKMIKDEKMDHDISFSIEHKEEPIDIHGHLSQYDHNSGMDDRSGNSPNEPLFNDHSYARIMVPSSEFLEELMNFDDKIYGESSDSQANTLIDNEGDNEKKRRLSEDDESTTTSRKLLVSKTNHTELKCPACEYRPRSVSSWVDHLKKQHSTTPALAGFALLCACGHESLSDRHSRASNHGNTVVIRKRNRRIPRMDNMKATPQCVLCEMYPKTARCYTVHLHVRHKTTLAEKGIYLVCSCGVEVRSITCGPDHLGECNPRQFGVRRLDGLKYVQRIINRKVAKFQATPQCVLCEAYPKTAHGYAVHLERHHKSSLLQNGIFLLCSCGQEVRSSFGSLTHLEECNYRYFTRQELNDK